MVEVEGRISWEILDVIREVCRWGRKFASCTPIKLVIFSLSNRESASASSLALDGIHIALMSMFLRAASRNSFCSGSIAVSLMVRLLIPLTTAVLS